MSVSTQPSTAATPWRVAVIGLVAVLAAGIGVAAGSFLLNGRTSPLGGGAAYVPSDAPFYLELRIEPSSEQDQALRELIAHFPPIDGLDTDRPLFEQLGERIDEMLLEEDAGLTWEADVAPWFDGHVALAVTRIPVEVAEAADPVATSVPDGIVMVGVTDAAAAQDAIERVLAEAGDGAIDFTESEHAGVTIRVPEGGDEGAYALTDDQLLLASSADVIRDALDTHGGTGQSLEDAEAIGRLTAQLPSDWLAFGTYDLGGLMAEALAQSGPEAQAVATAMGELMEHQPTRGAFALSASGDRLDMDAASDAPTGPFAVENADRGLVDEVPSDVLYYSESGNIGEFLTAIIEPMKQAAAGDPQAAEQIDTFEAALGADLEELVEWIEDGAIAIGWEGSEPYAGIVLVPNDVEAAERRLDQLASFAELGSLDPSSGITVEEEEAGETAITSIHWEDPNGAVDPMLPVPTGVVLQYAVTADRVLVGLGDAFVRRALDLDPEDSLAAVDRFTDAIAALGGPESAGATWLDLAGTREALEEALAPMLEGMGGADTYADEVAPWLLPLDRLVTVSRLEGEVLVQRTALLVE